MRYGKLQFIITVLCLLLSGSVWGENFKVDGIAYSTTSYNTCEVSKANYKGSVVIPSEVVYGGRRYSVTSIGNYAFEDCTQLVSVETPRTLESIRHNAFGGCTALREVRIAEGLRSLGDRAFYRCTGIVEIVLPEGLRSIGNGAFQECLYLEKIDIPNSVALICNSAFTNCSSLKDIALPESIIRIGDYAFSGCVALESITIPKRVTAIGYSTFSGCSALKLVKNLSPKPQTISSSTFESYGTLSIAPQARTAYHSAKFWQNFRIVTE